jgi:hypothetical protein
MLRQLLLLPAANPAKTCLQPPPLLPAAALPLQLVLQLLLPLLLLPPLLLPLLLPQQAKLLLLLGMRAAAASNSACLALHCLQQLLLQSGMVSYAAG